MTCSRSSSRRRGAFAPRRHGRRRTDPAGRTAAGGGYGPGDLVRIETPAGGTVRRDGPGRYTILDGGAHGAETTLTSDHPKAV